jgi:transposase InsO family protein
LAISNEKISAFTERKGIVQSMSRKLFNNAIIENFFGILKSELFYLKNTHHRPIKKGNK